jgi:hypothetical protein
MPVNESDAEDQENSLKQIKADPSPNNRTRKVFTLSHNAVYDTDNTGSRRCKNW